METNKVIEFDKLDIDNIKDTPYHIGKLTNEINTLLGLSLGERDIIIWKDRIKYIEKHKSDFGSEEEYKEHVEAIPSIVQSPDYVGLHPNGDGLEFIKRINGLMLVGVRIKSKGKLVVRSSYPIKETKLNNWLSSGRVKKM